MYTRKNQNGDEHNVRESADESKTSSAATSRFGVTSELTAEAIAELTSPKQMPCLSIYQPTHRRYPENKQDRIRFQNLIKEAKVTLLREHPTLELEDFFDPLERLANDLEFWNHTLDGMAVMRGPDLFRVFCVARPATELVILARSFHTKPLRRFLQTIDKFQILELSLDHIRLFEGNRDAVFEVELSADVPRTLTEALGNQLTDPHLTVASHGGVGMGSVPSHHGHGAGKEEIDIDTDRFFRVVDRTILEHHSAKSGLPLILAALPEQHHKFRKISQNPFLLAEGIKGNTEALSMDEVRVLAWQIVEPEYLTRLKSLGERFGEALSTDLGSDNLTQIAKAAIDGRVQTLLIEADREIPGRLDCQTGLTALAPLNDPMVDDLLDDLSDVVVAKGGEILVIPCERMPTTSGAAAIYRY